MADKSPQDVKSNNPRYRGMSMAEVVRVIMKPQHKDAAETLERLRDQAEQQSDG